MGEQSGFILYINISVCLLLLVLVLPTLLQRQSDVRLRLSFAFPFFFVIVTCLNNLLVFYTDDYRWLPAQFLGFVFPVLFGPAVYYYVLLLLEQPIPKTIYLNLLWYLPNFIFGIYLLTLPDAAAKAVFEDVKMGNNWLYELTNLTILLLVCVYCIKALRVIKRHSINEQSPFVRQEKLKRNWAAEYVRYILVNTVSFLIIIPVGRIALGLSQIFLDLFVVPVLFLVIYLLIAIRQIMMQNQYELLYVVGTAESEKRVQEQRLEISRNLHDSLGAHLTFINATLDSLQHIAKNSEPLVKAKIETLSHFSQSSMQELRNVLWILDQQDLSTDQLQQKIGQLVQQAGTAREDIEFSMSSEVDEHIKLPIRQAHNIFRAVQEIINNAIKHAKASRVLVQLSKKHNLLSVTITDDGRGFDFEQAQHKSFGLGNLQARMAEIGGTLAVESGREKGTRYLLQMTLTSI